MTRHSAEAARTPVWAAGLLVAAGAGVATAHGLYEVAIAARVPAGIAWLYPLITDGLALVAYASTARLTYGGRRYAWTVVVLAAGLSGLAQAAYLAGGVTGRELLKATELGGYIYAIGGAVVGRNKPFLAAAERYDVRTDTWTTVMPMGTGRGNPVVVTANGRIFVVGGAGGVTGAATPLTTCEVYDPQLDRWDPLPAPLPVARGSLCAERSARNSIVAIGGFEPNVVASIRVDELRI
jgi:N-acetylneuraminic acid mutarotase